MLRYHTNRYCPTLSFAPLGGTSRYTSWIHAGLSNSPEGGNIIQEPGCQVHQCALERSFGMLAPQCEQLMCSVGALEWYHLCTVPAEHLPVKFSAQATTQRTRIPSAELTARPGCDKQEPRQRAGCTSARSHSQADVRPRETISTQIAVQVQ